MDFLWHFASAEEVAAKQQTSPAGLDAPEVERRRGLYGENRFPSQNPPGILTIFLRQFLNPLIYILLAAALVSILIGEAGDAGFIFAVLAFNALVGSYQELKAERSSAALRNLLKTYARVRRQGAEVVLEAEELVPGDIVLLESGVKVPADLRLFSATGLQVDEALLTGESVAAEKNIDSLPAATGLGDRSNMAFAGSNVTSGRAVGIVVATGLQTELGKIARSVTEAETSKPPLIIRMESFTHQISIVIMGACLLLGAYEVYQGKNIHDVFLIVVALAVSAIPEGLPIAMTVALSVATRRMAQRNVIVRKLTAVEGLGSCTTIASDKTGTLTVNKQTLRRIFLYPGLQLQVSGEGYNADGQIRNCDGSPVAAECEPELREMARVGLLCNEATLVREKEEWKFSGDPVDISFLAFALKAGLDLPAETEAVESLNSVPFESERKYAAQFFRREGKIWVAVKGAVEAIVPMCCCDWDVARAGNILDPALIERETQRLSGGGFRVLALAVGQVPDKAENDYDAGDIRDLWFLGLAGLIDPIRPEAKVAVEKCRQAGIRVLMVTGDHPTTALAIGKELGIADDERELMSGAQWAEAVKEAMHHKADQIRVFARMTPLQKLEIVDALMQNGHFVAVTGDGANDAPALKRAHIGVAMGSGTDLAKESADIIVADDNFASLVAGVEEGRNAYANVRKVIWFLISNGMGLIVFFTLSLLMDWPLPLVAVQLLWLNLVANGIQDVALAFEQSEPGLMEKPPRSPQEGIFNRSMLEKVFLGASLQALICLGYWYWLTNTGMALESARNLLLLLLIFMGNLQVLSCRSEQSSVFALPLSRNWLLAGGILFTHGLHLAATRNAFFREVLSLEPVSVSQWLILFLLAAPLLVGMELHKKFLRE